MFFGPSCFAAWQIAECIQVNRIRAFRNQVSIDELFVADLIVGVVMNVLRHVAVENCKRGRVLRASAVHALLFAVLGSSKFGILQPEIGFDISAAARNRRIAMSPLVIAGPLRSAQMPMTRFRKCPAPTVAVAPATMLFLRNERRLTTPRNLELMSFFVIADGSDETTRESWLFSFLRSKSVNKFCSL